ncbi:MAG: amidohydrolase family protein [Deltaproteobacteria bacterium]|nr:amidohydrolase family protein [Deltaproteobacteria bacterium]
MNSRHISCLSFVASFVSLIVPFAYATTDTIYVNGTVVTVLAEKRHLTRQDLDKVSTRHPVWALHISGHFGVANSVALQIAAITKDTPQPSGGIIRKDEATGEPNGALEEQAMLQVMKLIPPPSLENRLAALRAAAADYARHGITTAQNGLTDERSLNVFQEVEKSEALPIRVVVWPDFATAQKMIDGGLKVDWARSRKLKLGAAKTFADGSIQGYTGYLTQPYHTPFHGDPAYRGYPAMPREKLTELVTTLHQAGFQLAIHGNGDAAKDIDVIETVVGGKTVYKKGE